MCHLFLICLLHFYFTCLYVFLVFKVLVSSSFSFLVQKDVMSSFTKHIHISCGEWVLQGLTWVDMNKISILLYIVKMCVRLIIIAILHMMGFVFVKWRSFSFHIIEANCRARWWEVWNCCICITVQQLKAHASNLYRLGGSYFVLFEPAVVTVNHLINR